MRREVGRHGVDRVRQILPGASHTGHDSLPAQLAFRADFARDARHFRREGTQLIYHDVDGFFELKNFAAHVHGDFFREVTVGDGNGHVGNVTNLSGEIARHLVDALGQFLPNAGDAFHFGLTAELAFRADFSRDAAHFHRESAELADHAVDQLGRAEVLTLERAAFQFQRHRLRKIALGHRPDDAPHLHRGLGQFIHQGVDRFNSVRPMAHRVAQGQAFADFSLFADLAAQSQQARVEVLHAAGDLVDAVSHAPFQPKPLRRQPRGKVAVSQVAEGVQQLLHENGVGRIERVHDGLS